MLLRKISGSLRSASTIPVPCHQLRVMSNAISDVKVVHDRANTVFLSTIPGCHEQGYLQYRWIDKKSVDLEHTVVPEEFRGRGVGKILAKSALDFVIKEDLQMKLTCWYLAKYVRENPEPEYTRRIIQ